MLLHLVAFVAGRVDLSRREIVLIPGLSQEFVELSGSWATA